MKKKEWQILLSYIRAHIGVALFLAGSAAVFAVVLFLSGLPAEPVRYAALLCAVGGVVCALPGYLQYRRRYKAAELALQGLPEAVDRLRAPLGAVEEAYDAALRRLCAMLAKSETDRQRQRIENADYFTMWIHQIKTPIAAMQLILREQDDKLFYSISGTTRAPRLGESDGVQYYFLTRADFEEKIAQNAFLEHARYVDNYYGTLEAPVNEKLAEGYDVILEIEVQGAMQVHEKRPDAVMVFIAPPSFEELAARLRGRGTEDEEKVHKRLETAKEELKHQDEFDYVVVNDEIDRAVREIQGILAARRA